jgi:membrane fusion protein (multidrug efflux system)
MYDSETLPPDLAETVARTGVPALAPPQPQAKPTGSLRKRLFAGLAGVVALGALGAGADWLLVSSRFVTTDNAYVDATSAQVTSQVAAPVSRLLVHDTQAVKQGQVLVTLDDTDAKIALASAEADLAKARRQVKGYLATDDSLAAQIGSKQANAAHAQAQIAVAKSDLDKAKMDLDRRKGLAASGFVSGEELTRVTAAYESAAASYQAAVAAQAQANADRAAAVASLNANATLTQGATVDTNPEVLAAQAKVDQARVDLERTVIRAPIDGVVAKTAIQVGQRVSEGAQLMTVVPVQQAYVDANFKEGQLTRVRIGQPVELTSDLYGSKVRFHGRVEGLAGGTGSAFALIPAQNATGNWIKVVQRLPVRVALDASELKAHPLRVGLSMNAKIDLKG